MNENKFDEIVKETLFSHTDDIVLEKERIKKEIEARLFLTEIKNRKKKKRKIIPFVVSVAVVTMISIGIQTDAGYAFIDKVKTWFEPQKEISQSIEGNKESVIVELHQSKKSEYVIYVDEERYHFIEGAAGQNDKIVTKIPLEDQYPEVSMEIIQELSLSPSEVTSQILKELETKGYEIVANEQVSSPQEAHMIYAVRDSIREWNTPVEKYYVIDNQEKNVFVLKQTYFVEAEEGHGARFDEMIKDFHIISDVH